MDFKNTQEVGLEMLLERYAYTKLPTMYGDFDLMVFRSVPDGGEHLLISKGVLSDDNPPFLRIHSECLTGEVFGSLRCDCKAQLDLALETIAKEEQGMVIYLRQHEGRGIGLGNKIKAYELQRTENLDTLTANTALGFPEELRSFSVAIAMLKFLKISKVRLNTNNPEKIAALEAAGISVVERVPSLSMPNAHNRPYLMTKLHKLGHHLEEIL